MPELPEVESLRLSLERVILGQKILKIEIKMPKLVTSNGTKRIADDQKVLEFVNNLQGEVIKSITRRNKNLIFTTQNGKIILVHLKMTGQMVFVSNNGKTTTGGHPILNLEYPNKHSYISFFTSDGALYYNDVRQFGYVLYFESLSKMLEAGHLQNLGLEPLDSEFKFDYFQKALQNSKISLKKMFLSGKIVVGLGNIYCDEVCFRAKVLPTRIGSSLSQKEYQRLFIEIKSVLKRAIEQGGSSVANYLMADGTKGNFAKEHLVYGRVGKACLVCGNLLQKITLESRTTVFCNICQK
jgi:formamidopyrimidine-DNA glycosylase